MDGKMSREELFKEYRSKPEGHGSVRDIFNSGYDARQGEIDIIESKIKIGNYPLTTSTTSIL
jgi:hypothetical protein